MAACRVTRPYGVAPGRASGSHTCGRHLLSRSSKQAVAAPPTRMPVPGADAGAPAAPMVVLGRRRALKALARASNPSTQATARPRIYCCRSAAPRGLRWVTLPRRRRLGDAALSNGGDHACKTGRTTSSSARRNNVVYCGAAADGRAGGRTDATRRPRRARSGRRRRRRRRRR